MCGGFDLEFNFTIPFFVGANVAIKFAVVGEFFFFFFFFS
jgi:hypothetical protein